jgi:transcriptional regulator with XRE-family HTH domain
MIDYVNTEELCFADWLSQTMTDNNLNASQLSRALSTKEHKVNRSTISLWLSGDRLPKDNLRARLAKYFVSLGMWSYSPMIREILWRVHVSRMRKNK